MDPLLYLPKNFDSLMRHHFYHHQFPVIGTFFFFGHYLLSRWISQNRDKTLIDKLNTYKDHWWSGCLLSGISCCSCKALIVISFRCLWVWQFCVIMANQGTLNERKNTNNNLDLTQLAIFFYIIFTIAFAYLHQMFSDYWWTLNNIFQISGTFLNILFDYNIPFIYMYTPVVSRLSLVTEWQKVSSNFKILTHYPLWLLYFIHLDIYNRCLVVITIHWVKAGLFKSSALSLVSLRIISFNSFTFAQ